MREKKFEEMILLDLKSYGNQCFCDFIGFMGGMRDKAKTGAIEIGNRVRNTETRFSSASSQSY